MFLTCFGAQYSAVKIGAYMIAIKATRKLLFWLAVCFDHSCGAVEDATPMRMLEPHG